jgi:peptidoglycan hydrolase CwlO-like protein
MTENDNITYQAWLNDLQITVDSLREQRDEDRSKIAELQKEISMYKSMVERLRLALSQGSEL